MIIHNAAGASAVNIQDGGNSITIDGTVTASGTVTANAGTGFPPVQTDGAAAGTTGIHVLGTDGTNAQIISTNSTGHVNIADGGNSITVDGSVAVSNAGGASAVNIQDGGNSITVDGTVTANAGTGFPPVVTDGAAAGTTGIHVLGTDGTNAQIIATETTGFVKISDGGGSITVDGSLTATFTSQFAEDTAHVSADTGMFVLGVRNDADASTTSTDGDYSAFSTDVAGRQKVAGQVAHDAVTAGNPLALAANARTTLPTAVSAEDDAVRLVADLQGRQVHLPYATPGSAQQGRTGAFNSTANQALFAAGAAGVRNYVTGVTLANSSDSTVLFTIKDGTTALYDVVVDARSSHSVEFAVPLRGTAATAINVATDAAIASAYASATGYQATV